ncbi:MAG: phage tail sheath subtilisin-like domain-containing protein [Rhodobacteraceae bacterium]|nr:phage tail sheath subtilisin-like domain-containing protein [Paracoccaceae bacterium]
MFDTPGVYVREIPSGNRPISGVATSTTAFVCVTGRGPVNRAVRVTSYGEFERIYGGLMAGTQGTYAVRNYFLNGGSVAFIVRVTAGDGGNAPAAATESVPVLTPAATTTIDVTANSVGVWGDQLRVGIAHAGAGATRFTMLVREYEGDSVVREEAFLDVSINEADPRYVETVVAAESELVTVAHTDGALPDRTMIGTPAAAATTLDALLEAPADALTQLDGGDDGILPGNTDAWEGEVVATMVGEEGDGSAANPPTGMFALNTIAPEVFNLLCLPDVAVMNQADGTRLANMAGVYQAAAAYCRRNFAFLLVDVPPDVDRSNFGTWLGALGAAAGPDAAMYYPRVNGPDPLNGGALREMATSGIAAGQYARTDAARGVWKAPAGTEARIAGGVPSDPMTDRQQGPLNTQGVNTIRTFPVYGSVIWGARTLDGADARASEWRYVPVRRLALFIENSLQRGLQWVVFEPNDEPLWANVRLSVNAFMSQLHRQGAFQGASARDAYLVKCDSETTTQADINLGILNIYVGFAPVRPAEFIVLRIQQRIQRAT